MLWHSYGWKIHLTNLTSNKEPDWAASSPRRFLTYGRAYLKASEVISRCRDDPNLPLPELALACQGLELILKGYLRHRGVGDEDLRKIGHNLVKLLHRCEASGLYEIMALTDDEQRVIEAVNKAYVKRILQYAPSVVFQNPLDVLAAAVRGVAIKAYNGLARVLRQQVTG